LASLLLRQHPGRESAETHRAASLTIEATTVLPLQIDGGAVRLKQVTPRHGCVTYAFTTIAGGITMLVPRGYDGALFQHDALLSAHTGAARAHAGADSTDHDGSSTQYARRGDRLYEVLAVGIDSITVVHAGTGAVMTVRVGPDTRVEGFDMCDDRAAPSPVSRFQAGDTVHLKGKTNGKHTRMQARRVTLLSPRRWVERGAYE
jgi:hypothetical protein